MKVHINRNGNPVGPFTVEQARDMVENGELKGNDQVWIEGTPDWVAVDTIPELEGPPEESTPASATPAITTTGGPVSPGTISMEVEPEKSGSPSQSELDSSWGSIGATGRELLIKILLNMRRNRVPWSIAGGGVLVCLAALMLVLSGPQKIDETDDEGRIRVSYQAVKRKGELVKHGWYRRFGEDGRKIEEGRYRDDEKHGRFAGWYSSGEKHFQACYARGELHGAYEEWYENRNGRVRCVYKEGHLEGKREEWFENGNLKGGVHSSRIDELPQHDKYLAADVSHKWFYLTDDNRYLRYADTTLEGEGDQKWVISYEFLAEADATDKIPCARDEMKRVWKYGKRAFTSTPNKRRGPYLLREGTYGDFIDVTGQGCGWEYVSYEGSYENGKMSGTWKKTRDICDSIMSEKILRREKFSYSRHLSKSGGTSVLYAETFASVVNSYYGRVCNAKITYTSRSGGFTGKTLQLDWTRSTNMMHTMVIMAEVGKAKEHLALDGVFLFKFPNDGGTYNVVSWLTGDKISIPERARYYFPG